MSLSDIELTILSLVAEGNRYGADIERQIEKRGLREWLRIGSASVYYILGMLEKHTLITRRGDGISAVYEITEAGRGILQTAVNELLRQPPSLLSGFGLGLANLHTLKPLQVYRALVQYRALLQQQIDGVSQQPTTDATHFLVTRGLALLRAELEWLEGFIADWQVRYPAVERDGGIEDSPHTAPTQVHSPTVNPAKQMQRIPRKPE